MCDCCHHFIHPSWQVKPTSWGVLRLFWHVCIWLCTPQCLSTHCIWQYSVVITAEVSQILASCEIPIQREQFSLVKASGTLYSLFIFRSLYVPAGVCILCISVPQPLSILKSA